MVVRYPVLPLPASWQRPSDESLSVRPGPLRQCSWSPVGTHDGHRQLDQGADAAGRVLDEYPLHARAMRAGGLDAGAGDWR